MSHHTSNVEVTPRRSIRRGNNLDTSRSPRLSKSLNRPTSNEKQLTSTMWTGQRDLSSGDECADELDHSSVPFPNQLYHEEGESSFSSPSKKLDCGNWSSGSSQDISDDSIMKTRSQTDSKDSGFDKVVERKKLVSTKNRSPGKSDPELDIRQVTTESGAKAEVKHEHLRGVGPVVFISVTLCLLVCLYVVFYFVYREQMQPTPPRRVKSIDEIYADLKFELKQIRQEFVQTKHFWIQLASQLNSVMETVPLQPAVFLVVVPRDSKSTATCLTHRISTAIQRAFEDSSFVMYDTQSTRGKSPARLKEDLDLVLTGLERAHAAVVHNIEIIPGSAATIFHKYCDNENAQHKRAVIFLMMEVSAAYTEVQSSALDQTADSQITLLWGQELHEKDVSALVSRVANAPVLIKPEEQAILDAHCTL